MNRRRFFVGLSLFLWVLVLVSLFSVAPAQEALKGVLPSIELLPDPSNLLTIPGLKVRIIQDPERGEVLKIEQSGQGQAGQPPQGYTIEVNEEQGTYKIIPIDPPTDPNSGVWLEQQSSATQFYPAQYTPVRYVPVQSYRYQGWWAGISLGTSDQAGIKLTSVLS